MGHREGDPRPDQQIQSEPGDNSRKVQIVRVLSSQPVVDPTDSNAVSERYLWFLDMCEEWDIRPTVEGLALAMGVDRVTLRRWKDGEVKYVSENARLTLKKAWDGMNQIMTMFMMEGKLNPATAIFLLKNNFGYRDVVEQVIQKKDPYETGSPEEIARRYLSGMAPALDSPAQDDRPVVETVVIDQTGKVE